MAKYCMKCGGQCADQANAVPTMWSNAGYAKFRTCITTSIWGWLSVQWRLLQSTKSKWRSWLGNSLNGTGNRCIGSIVLFLLPINSMCHYWCNFRFHQFSIWQEGERNGNSRSSMFHSFFNTSHFDDNIWSIIFQCGQLVSINVNMRECYTPIN